MSKVKQFFQITWIFINAALSMFKTIDSEGRMGSYVDPTAYWLVNDLPFLLLSLLV